MTTQIQKSGGISTRLAVTALLLLAATVACASPIGSISSIVVTEKGIGPENDGCKKYSLTTAQVRAFMSRAVVISARQEHDFFLYGPCAVRGTLKTRYGIWQWEIRNAGTGSLVAASGEVFLLGDPKQESSISGE